MELRTENVVKIYRSRTVVKEVSVNVRQGEIVGLLGPNGAGKTTTFYMIVGIIKPYSGKVYLDDREITRMPMYRRAQLGVGYLAQEASVFRQMTVENNIMAILEFRKDLTVEQRREKLESLISEFGLEKIRRSKGIQLSVWTPLPCRIFRISSRTLRIAISASSSPTTMSTKRSASPTAPICSTKAECFITAPLRRWQLTLMCVRNTWVVTLNSAAPIPALSMPSDTD